MAATGDFWKKLTRPTASCPEIETLALYREGELPSGLHDHVQNCSRCSAELKLLESFFESREKAGEEADLDWIVAELDKRGPNFFKFDTPTRDPTQTRTASSSRWPAWALSLAAAVLLAVVGISVLLDSTRGPGNDPLTAPGFDVTRSTDLEILSPKGSIESTPQSMSWQPVEEAGSYSVTLSSVDGAELWQGHTPGNSIRLPEEIQALFLPGRKLFLQVRAFDQDRREIARSSRTVVEVEVSR